VLLELLGELGERLKQELVEPDRVFELPVLVVGEVRFIPSTPRP
jgi:hypothetical protein